MGKSKGVIYLVLIVGGAIASYFTIGGKAVAKWNDKAIAIEESFGLAWKDFEPNISPWLEGQPLDVEKTEAAFETYSGRVVKASGDMRRTNPPDDAICKDFHLTLIEYADLQEAQLKDLRKILDGMKAANPGKEADRKKAADAIDALGKKESEIQDIISGKQKNMATKFKLKLQ